MPCGKKNRLQPCRVDVLVLEVFMQLCTCLGSCKGKEGLGPGWKCALETSAVASDCSKIPVDEWEEASPERRAEWKEISRKNGFVFVIPDDGPERV
jgi:hypothetical protein